MQQIIEFIEKLFFYLLKFVSYLMKLSFGLVIGLGTGLSLFIIFGNNPGKYLFFLCAATGLISGIIYAEKKRRNSKFTYFESEKNELTNDNSERKEN